MDQLQIQTTWEVILSKVVQHCMANPGSLLISERKSVSLRTLGCWKQKLTPPDQVGGHITLTLAPSSLNASLSLAFTESPLFIGPISDDSSFPSANQSYDGALALPSPLPSGSWTMPTEKLRGGFRYLTIVSTSMESVTVLNVTIAIEFMPHWDDLRAYTGYFYANGQEILNKAWYAGVSNFFFVSDTR